MLETLKKIFARAPEEDYREMVRNGAIILDVRSKGEYAAGHIKGSINIPLDQIQSQLGRLKDKSQPIITCCASGMRSGSAKRFLKSVGYTQVYNGGGWTGLQARLN